MLADIHLMWYHFSAVQLLVLSCACLYGAWLGIKEIHAERDRIVELRREELKDDDTES